MQEVGLLGRTGEPLLVPQTPEQKQALARVAKAARAYEKARAEREAALVAAHAAGASMREMARATGQISGKEKRWPSALTHEGVRKLLVAKRA